MRAFKAIALADLHCGCPRLDPMHFQACIEKYVIPRITKEITHLFICGDFFDLLINMNSIASMVAMTVIAELKCACFTAGTKLCILRGTFTHDRNQPKHFLCSSREYNDCVRLYDSLCVVEDEDVGMSFMYMPDNLPYNDIYDEIEKMFEAHARKHVDVVIHHGYFKHMLPYGIPEPNGTLDYEKFKKFYTGCVLNGHVHTTSIYQNVVSVGSFDRLAYGEEEDKGFYIITRKEDGSYSYEFVVNEDANPFWTVNLQGFNGDSTQAAFDYFEREWVPKLQKANEEKRTVHIRLLSDVPGILDGLQTRISDNFSFVIVNRGVVTKREQIVENVKMNLEELPQISPDNVEDLLLPIIKKVHPNATPQEIHSVLEECRDKVR